MTFSIAIAVSGLGRIQRGSEAWATDLAEALHRNGVPVRLFAAACVPTVVPTTVLRTLSRTSVWLRFLSPKQRYLVEQKLFTKALLRQFRVHGPEVVHLTDPQVAWWTRDAVRGSGPPVFYMDGLMLGPDWNWRFEHVQVLAPEYVEAAKRAGRETHGWTVIPHFVDTTRFVPKVGHEAGWAGRPSRSLQALSVGDFAPGSSKRLHYIVEEFARIPEAIRPRLLLVGNATPDERRQMERFAGERLGGGVELRTSLPRSEMLGVYQRADFLVHAALREPFGIVLLEAMSCGLPVLGHSFPVTRWIVGEGGSTANLEQAGALADLVRELVESPTLLADKAVEARRRAIGNFSEAAVLPQYLAAYARISRGGVGPGIGTG